ncbi:hypothetical protein HDU86_003722 [Geranomyces michiganensis]|nr:hypothetical protein HDU86_003722 [Geranomyces michiganensis]
MSMDWSFEAPAVFVLSGAAALDVAAPDEMAEPPATRAAAPGFDDVIKLINEAHTEKKIDGTFTRENIPSSPMSADDAEALLPAIESRENNDPAPTPEATRHLYPDAWKNPSALPIAVLVEGLDNVLSLFPEEMRRTFAEEVKDHENVMEFALMAGSQERTSEVFLKGPRISPLRKNPRLQDIAQDNNLSVDPIQLGTPTCQIGRPHKVRIAVPGSPENDSFDSETVEEVLRNETELPDGEGEASAVVPEAATAEEGVVVNLSLWIRVAQRHVVHETEKGCEIEWSAAGVADMRLMYDVAVFSTTFVPTTLAEPRMRAEKLWKEAALEFCNENSATLPDGLASVLYPTNQQLTSASKPDAVIRTRVQSAEDDEQFPGGGRSQRAFTTSKNVPQDKFLYALLHGGRWSVSNHQDLPPRQAEVLIDVDWAKRNLVRDLLTIRF